MGFLIYSFFITPGFKVFLNIFFLLIIHIIISKIQAKENGIKRNPGNVCPESRPWPCKSGLCLSFDFICDEEYDCPDKYDEDPALCIAKNRPPVSLLEQFLLKWQGSLIPKLFGNESPKVLADKLVESLTIEDYKKAAKLTSTQYKTFYNVMEAVRKNRRIDWLMMGLPDRAWNDFYNLFRRFLKSGFLGKVEIY